MDMNQSISVTTQPPDLTSRNTQYYRMIGRIASLTGWGITVSGQEWVWNSLFFLSFFSAYFLSSLAHYLPAAKTPALDANWTRLITIE